MPESDEGREKRLLRELEGKNVAHFSILLGWWIQSRMEFDKTLLTLSSVGIGLLITILITLGAQSSIDSLLLILFIGAFLGFVTCIGSTLTTYRLNSQYIEGELKTKDSAEVTLKLKNFDKLNLGSFILGIVFFFAIGVVATLETFEKKGDTNMANEKETTQLPTGDTFKKSLEGLSNLRPEQPPAAPPPEPSQQQNSSSGTSGGTESGPKE